MKRFSPIQAGIVAALILALVGSVQNVAWAFASVQGGNVVWGWVQAAAVDVGLLMLALGIQERRRLRRPVTLLWCGVAFFSLISCYANLLHGITHAEPLATPLAVARPALLAAVLPAMVLLLSEVAGYDVQRAMAAAERERRKEERLQEEAKDAELLQRDGTIATQSGNAPQFVESGNGNHGNWRNLAVALRNEHPDWTQRAIAEACGVAPSTISRHFAELREEA